MDSSTALIPTRIALATTNVVKITVVQGRELTKKTSRKCYVVVTVDDTKETTKEVASTSGWHWNEGFTFNASGTSTLSIQIYGRHTFNRVEAIGDCERSLVDLLKMGCSGDFELPLENLTTKSKLRPCIFLLIEINLTLDQMFTAMTVAVQEASRATHQMQEPRINSLSPVMNSSDVSSVVDYVQTWKPLLEKLKLFDDLAGTISELHPVAKTAYMVIVAAYKIIEAQVQRDARVVYLGAVMDDLYGFVQDAEPLKRIKSQEQIMVQIAQQTTECGHFIAAYCKDSFVIRLRNNLITSPDSVILQYTDKFRQLKENLINKAIIQAEVLVL